MTSTDRSPPSPPPTSITSKLPFDSPQRTKQQTLSRCFWKHRTHHISKHIKSDGEQRPPRKEGTSRHFPKTSTTMFSPHATYTHLYDNHSGTWYSVWNQLFSTERCSLCTTRARQTATRWSYVQRTRLLPWRGRDGVKYFAVTRCLDPPRPPTSRLPFPTG